METKDIFEEMAKRYDNEERTQNAQIIAEAIRSELNNSREKTALDYGCGTGLVGLQLVDLFKSILFVDVAPQMIAQVDLKLEKQGISNGNTLAADFSEGIPDEVFVDYIIMSQVLLHVKDYEGLLKNLYTLLNKGGCLIIVDFDENEKINSDKVHNGFNQKLLLEELGRIGFRDGVSHIFHRGEKIFMNEDASLFILKAFK